MTAKEVFGNISFSDFFKSAGVGMVVLDSSARILESNTKINRLLGYRKGELVDLPHILVYENKEFFSEIINRINKNQRTHVYPERVLIKKNKEKLPCKLTVSALNLQGSKEKRYLCMFEDISVKIDLNKQLITKNRKLAENEAMFRDLFENASDLIQVVSAEGAFLYVNSTWVQTLGYSQKEALQMKFLDVIHPDCHPQCLKLFGQIISGKQIEPFRTTFMSRKGKQITVEGNVSIKRENGETVSTRGIFRDITKQAETERILMENIQDYHDLVENSYAYLCIHDAEGKILRVNNAANKAAGYFPETLEGKNLREVLDTRFHEGFDDYLERIFVNKEDHGIFPLITRSGEKRYWSYRNIVKKSNTDDNYVVGYSQDVTNEIKTQRALEDSEKRMKYLYAVTSLPGTNLDEKITKALKLITNSLKLEIGIISTIENDNYTVQYVFDQQKRIAPNQQFKLGDTYCDITYREGTTVAISHMKKSTYHKHPSYQKLRLEAYIGCPVYVNNRIYGTLNFTSPTKRPSEFNHTDKEFVEITSNWIGQAITEQNAVQNLVEVKNRLDLALRASNVGTWDWDAANNRLVWDERMYGLYGIDPTTFAKTYQAYEQSIHPDDREWVKKSVNQALAEGEEFNEVFRICLPSGEIRYIQAQSKTLRDATGKPNRMIGVNIDITELVRAKNQAEEAAKIKQDFLANMSHEIRTPMNAISGFSRILLKNEVTPEERNEYLQLIYESSENLQVIIDDILDLSKIEAGKIEIVNDHFDLRELLDQLQKLYSFKVEDKGIELLFDIDDQIPQVLIGDPIRLYQVLNNLLSNAVKFTNEGFVKLTVDAVKGKGRNQTLVFSIADTGIGIGEENLQSIFESFEQIRTNKIHQQKGTGLGLSIVKQLTELMGGTAEVFSKVGRGSTFTISLGLIEGDIRYIKKFDEEPQPADQSYMKNVRVLLADDYRSNRLLCSRYLKEIGCKVDMAENGEAVVKKVLANDYHLILMDIQMPLMDGVAATEKIRQMSGSKAQIPIIALTAHAIKGDEQKYIEAGMNDYISKPFKPKILLEKMMGILSPKKTQSIPKVEDFEKHQTKIISLENLYSYGLGPGFVSEMLQTYLTEIPNLILEVERNLNHDRKTFIRAVHTLKSSAAIFDMKKVAETLNHWEELDEGLFDTKQFIESFTTIKDHYNLALEEMTEVKSAIDASKLVPEKAGPV